MSTVHGVTVQKKEKKNDPQVLGHHKDDIRITYL